MSFFPPLGALWSTIQYYKYKVELERVERMDVSTAEYWLKVLEAVSSLANFNF